MTRGGCYEHVLADVRAKRADAESTGHDEFFSNLGEALFGAADLEI